METFLRERLFALLAMGDTSFAVPPEKHDRLAVAYAKAATGELTVWDHPHSTRCGPILLKARTQGFHGSLIKGHEKTRKRRAMGQLIATKQGREWFGKRRTNQEDEVRKGLCFGKPLASYGHQLDGIAVVS